MVSVSNKVHPPTIKYTLGEKPAFTIHVLISWAANKNQVRSDKEGSNYFYSTVITCRMKLKSDSYQLFIAFPSYQILSFLTPVLTQHLSSREKHIYSTKQESIIYDVMLTPYYYYYS